MSIIHAIILGIVQGLSEFLPISSSGHLIFIRDLLGWNFGTLEIEKTFFGMSPSIWGLFSVLRFIFGKISAGYFVAFSWRSRDGSLSADPYSKLAILILISTIPAAIAGIKGEEFVEKRLGAPILICGQLIAFGLLLWLADWMGKRQREMSSVSWKDSIIIGLSQALALAPGTSRSGVTMTAGLFLGLNRQTAARYSFLISLPVIAGAALYKGAKLAHQGVPAGLEMPMIAGILAATISGFLAIFWLLRYLQTHSLMPFVVYRLLVGIGLAAYFVAR